MAWLLIFALISGGLVKLPVVRAAQPAPTVTIDFYILGSAETAAFTMPANPVTVTAVFAKSTATVEATATGWVYDGTNTRTVVSNVTANGTVTTDYTVTYRARNAQDSTAVSTVPTNAGHYTAIVTLNASHDYSGTGYADFTVEKAEGVAVSGAPALSLNTSLSITVTAVTSMDVTKNPNVQYAISTVNNALASELSWGSVRAWTGLVPNTTYYAYARTQESANFYAGPMRVSEGITTDKATLSGSVTITGDTVSGDALTAIHALSSTPNVALGEIYYQWNRGGTPINGATSSTYTLVAADVGHTITVTVTAANTTGMVTSTPTATVTGDVNQTLTAADINRTVGDGGFDLSDHATSTAGAYGGTISYEVTSVGTTSAVITGTMLSYTAAGTATITATAAENNDFLSATTTFTLTVANAPTYTISLSPATDRNFGMAVIGYGTQTPHIVTINNEGNQATGDLTVALSGTNASSFTLSTSSISSIAVGGDSTFTVVPNIGLAVGTYLSTVTVSGGNGISESFNVSFEVEKANPTVNWPTDLTAIAGQTLGNIALPDNGKGTPGAFSWTAPLTSVGAAGTQSHNLTFTPVDADNFNMASQNVDITVSAATVMGITVHSTAHKTAYIVGDTLDITNLTIQATLDYGASYIVPVTAGMVSGFDSSAPVASQILTITYSGQTEVFNISISSVLQDAILIGVTSSATLVVANGTAKTAAAFGLPAMVTMVTDSGDVSTNVTWDVDASTYNPALTTEQIFTVNGTVALPNGVINPNGVSLAVSVSVTVSGLATVYHTVTFNPNNGTVTETSRQVAANTAVGTLPAPTRHNHNFNGWFDGSTQWTASTIVTGNVTLTASWTERSSGGNSGDGSNNWTPALQPTPQPTPAPTESTTPDTTPPQIQSLPLPFGDISPSAWYYRSVRVVWENQLFNGTSPNSFDPQSSMTRAMFIQVLANLERADLSVYRTQEPRFADTGTEAWYFSAIQWAVEQGLASGVGGGNFAPEKPITREEMAVLLNNYIVSREIVIPQDTARSFADQNNISEWALNGVMAIRAAGIISGYPDGNFAPQNIATKAEVAAIFARFLEVAAFL